MVEDQARLRVKFQQGLLYLLFAQQTGRELLSFEVAVYGVVAEALEELGQIGQSVVDLAAQ